MFGKMNGNTFEAIWNLQQKATEEENRTDEENQYGVVYGNLTEDEIMQQLRDMSGKIAELNREIRTGLDAIHKKMEIKKEMKNIMKQFIREF